LWWYYPLVMTNIANWTDPPFFVLGKPSINGPWLPWLC
jgi:hypothetical protein